MRQFTSPGAGFRFGPPLTPTVKLLLAANVTVFLVTGLLGSTDLGERFVRFFGLMPAKALGQVHLWQFVTYMFLHDGFRHILFNMFALWMFGGRLEALWGSRHFLQFYLVTGVGGALVYVLIMPVLGADVSHSVLMGASGAVYGILTAYALLFPDQKVLLYFVVPIRIRWLVIGLIVFETLMMWSNDGVAHLAHLGGALAAFLYLRGGRRWFDRQMAARRRRKASSRFRVVGDDEQQDGWKPKAGREIDVILEKISREGLDSLTPEEQEILRRASRR